MKKIAMILLIVIIAILIAATALQLDDRTPDQKNQLYYQLQQAEEINIDYNYTDTDSSIPQRIVTAADSEGRNLISSMLMYIGDARLLDALDPDIYGDYSPTTGATHLIRIHCKDAAVFTFYYNHDLNLLTLFTQSTDENGTPVVTLANYQIHENFRKFFEILPEPDPITPAPETYKKK